MKRIINIILITIIIFCIAIIRNKYYHYHVDNVLNEEIQQLAPMANEVFANNIDSKNDGDSVNSEEASNVEEINAEFSANEAELKAINDDYKMWVQIKNSEINYPVVQGTDNEYYLEHNFKGEPNISGTIFIDYLNNIEDKNIVIYGHNMKNGTMFNNLTKYKEEQFFNDNNIINIIKDNRLYQYKVVSVYVEEADKLKVKLAFDSNEEFINYASKEIDKSIYKNDVSINEDDKLITLITCSYEYTDARTVVVAVRK